jgi:hypothetical protein
LLKFGNPPIMERWVSPPENFLELLLGSPWPIGWAYGLLLLLAVVAVFWVWRQPSSDGYFPGWINLLPVVWLAWQAIVCSQTLSLELSLPTLKHFVSCVVCFYIGFYCLSGIERLVGFWVGLLCGFTLVLIVGWQQHFGGLQSTREFFFREIYPNLKEVSPEYLKKMSSNRIFSTLFYPNSLAGALLLFLPVTLALIAQARLFFTRGARVLLVLLVAVAALGCLLWSGSKGGWLLMLLLGWIALLRVETPKSVKYALVAAVLVAGLSGFLWRYAGFFEKGATSVSARLDYWEAAVKTAMAHPVTGTGPGTFMIPYRKIKRPESEMTRMVHNDYLEQASDSGWVGFLLYLAFILGSVVGTGRLVWGKGGGAAPSRGGSDWTTYTVWLGVLGWSLQGLSEFSLYVPALAWPAFTFLGLLAGRLWKRIDNPGNQGYAKKL